MTMASTRLRELRQRLSTMPDGRRDWALQEGARLAQEDLQMKLASKTERVMSGRPRVVTDPTSARTELDRLNAEIPPGAPGYTDPEHQARLAKLYSAVG